MPPIPAAKKKVIPPYEVERKVIYPTLSTDIYAGDNSMDSSIAKDLLGWREETEEEKFKDDYLLIDENGVKIRCLNNDHNRPFNETWAKTLAQEHLNKKFAPKGPNGEAVIIGRTGLTVSAQHRLVGLVLAQQILENDKTGHWKEKWPEGTVMMQTFVNYGVDESAETTITLDNVRTRTLGDSLYTSGLWSTKGIKRGEREKLTKTLEHAVRFLWDRTGMKDDAYSPYRTNSECKDFIDRHKSITRAVKHIFEEEFVKKGSKKAISQYLPIGRASGLLYLMMACKSDGEAYRKAELRSENILDMDMRDKATEFWTLLADGSGRFILVKKAIDALKVPETMTVASVPEKEAIILKAWEAFMEDKPLTEGMLKLEYHTEDDVTSLVNPPSVGGIDFAGMEASEPKKDEPSKEEIEAERLAIRKQKQEEMKAKLRAAQGQGAKPAAEEPKKEEKSEEHKDKKPKNKPKSK